DVEPVDVRRVLGQGVEPRLDASEVVVLGPVARELLEELELHALRGVLDDLAGRPSRLPDAATEIVDLLLRDLDGERPGLDPGVDGRAHEDLPWRSVLNAARISVAKSSGSSQAAKW